MFQLGSPAPVTHELIAASGDRPAVKVTFNPQPTPLSLRMARAAVAAVMRDGLPEALQRAADAFTAALIRHNILAWEGLGDASDTPVLPTPDTEIRNDDGEVVGSEPGTITAFLSEPRLVEAADREYVLPWTRLDAEKNGFAPSRNGTSAGATPASNTADAAATATPTADAGTKPPASRRARTKSTKPGPKRAKRSGS